MRPASLLIVLWLIAVSVIAAVTIPTIYLSASAASRRARKAVADACAAEIRVAPPGSLEITMDTLRGRYGLHDIRPGHGVSERGYIVEYRRVGATEITIVFEPDPLNSARQTVMVMVGVAFIGIIGGIALLANLGSRMQQPETAMKPAGAQLVETFQTSIRTMRVRETELQRSRDEEKQRADHLAHMTETLVRSMSSGFLSVDQHGLLVDMNDAAREVLRLPERSIRGSTIVEAIGDTAFSRRLQEAVTHRESLQRVEIESPEDDQLVGLSTVALLDEEDRYFGMLALFTDLAPVRKLEQRLRDMQSLAQLGEMSAGIAHEFRNSLSTVIGYLSLARKTGLSSEAEERIARADREARQLNSAVESLLAFARPMKVALQPVTLRALFDEVLEQMHPVSEGIAFSVTGDARITGDPILLKRLVENVVRNAVDAIREKGTSGHVDVTIAREREVVVVVRDDGIGVDPSRAASFFLPFQSTKPQGYGLGLALARKIAMLHNAAITLTGRPGAGASLEIRFAD
jgi:C4-dicarboxylate-specific signal transduction histidine kinase